MAYKVLPRPQFATLQQNIFPVFFALQTILPLVMIATYPGEQLLGVGGADLRVNTGFNGVIADSNRWSILVPFATMVVSSAINMFFLGPATTKTMKARHHQGKSETSHTASKFCIDHTSRNPRRQGKP